MIKIIKAKKDWQNILNTVDSYDFYHTYDYHSISKTDEEAPILITYVNNDILIAFPLLVKKIFDTEYCDATSVYGYCGPLSKNIDSNFDNSTFKKLLKDFFKEQKIVSVFSRLNPFIDNQKAILFGLGEVNTLGQVVNIDISTDLDVQKKNISKTTKRYIKKTRKFCEISIGNSDENIKNFIDLYYENMDRVAAKKSYYFDEEYVRSFLNSAEFEASIYIAKYIETGEIISAAIMVKTNKIIQYHISGTKNDYLHLTPIRILIDEMRIKGTEENYEYFNLGGGLGSKDDNLFFFKSSFSNNFKDFKVWKYINDQPTYDQLCLDYSVPDVEIDFFPKYRNKV